MAAFSYRALDANGLQTSGTVESENARQARVQLRERGLFPTSIEAVERDEKRTGRVRLRSAELCLLTRQFSALLSSGLTVEQTLGALVEQADSPNIRAVLAAVRSDILAGHSLRSALDRFGYAFPPIYRASVAAGEKSGQLAMVMSQLAEYLERQDTLRRKTLQALLYPIIVAVVALLVVIGLMTYVVPQVIEVFQHSKQTLPLLTRALVFASAILRSYGWLMALMLALGIIAFRYALRDESIRYRWDAYLLAQPLLGKHLRALDTSRFASTLAILVSSGIPLLGALDAGRQVITRLPIRQAVAQAADRVREGTSLSTALRQTHAFPPLLAHMAASGEATGELSTMLSRCAQLQQNEVETRTATLTTVLEPLLLLFMGGTVLLIVLAVMQPIINMNTLVK
ncbi:type II secretion system inner membrane protein GspF [Uliginosibacterium gangwonense]|uniref:type II secretion system inner membrane protein GspF n=1 Tax=Uliginosibacterium gangwonense TaxID=392736 RepID=UPI0003633EEC|nr:type II secretion system inner membrane protein GspF [Uliginosibacterium gangwonense]